jgi:hypothetical protein
MGRGYTALDSDPAGALDDLLAENAALDRRSQTLQLNALLEGNAFSKHGVEATASIAFDLIPVLDWIRFAAGNGVVPIDVGSAEQRNELLDGFDGRFATACREKPAD